MQQKFVKLLLCWQTAYSHEEEGMMAFERKDTIVEKQQGNQDDESLILTTSTRVRSKSQSRRKRSTYKTKRHRQTRSKKSWLTDECIRSIIALVTLATCIIVLVFSIIYKNTTLIVGSSSIGAVALKLVYGYYFGALPPK
jgi:hypothetical protein